MGATGTTTIDFGAFPGATDTSVAVTGQASIVSGSIVGAWIRPVATADHTADEHWVDCPEITAGNIAAGTGFTIYAKAPPQMGGPVNTKSAEAQRLYGVYTVAWAWV